MVLLFKKENSAINACAVFVPVSPIGAAGCWCIDSYVIFVT